MVYSIKTEGMLTKECVATVDAKAVSCCVFIRYLIIIFCKYLCAFFIFVAATG